MYVCVQIRWMHVRMYACMNEHIYIYIYIYIYKRYHWIKCLFHPFSLGICSHISGKNDTSSNTFCQYKKIACDNDENDDESKNDDNDDDDDDDDDDNNNDNTIHKITFITWALPKCLVGMDGGMTR